MAQLQKSVDPVGDLNQTQLHAQDIQNVITEINRISDVLGNVTQLTQYFNALQPVSAVVSENGGQGGYSDIQTAVSAIGDSGGTVLIRNGTYTPSGNIMIPSNVTVQGETAGGVIIDFQNQAFQIMVAGTLLDNTGTVSINNKSTAVTGSGTAFSTSFVGQAILLKGRWFTISAVADTTHLTIDTPFDADNISGQASFIATTVNGSTLLDFTVQNSTHANGAVFFQDAQSCALNNVTALNSTIGENYNRCSNQNSQGFFIGLCGNGLQVTNSGVWTLYNFEVYGSTNVNFSGTSFYNLSVSNATLSSATGNNVTLNGCEAWSYYDMENTSAGGKGIELTSCTDIEIFAQTIREAASDGIKLTSGCSRVSINNATLKNNGGYGVNIAAGSDDRTTITSSYFTGNTSGTINNSGTNTINANNN